MAEFHQHLPGPDNDKLAGALGRMLHIDDLERLGFIANVLGREAPPSAEECVGREARLLAALQLLALGLERATHADRRRT